VLTETLSWRWVLLINVPICATMAVAALAYVRHVVDRAGHRRSDATGALLVTAGLVLVTYGIVGTESYGWGSLRTLLTVAGGLTVIGLFVFIESRVPDPLVPLRIFTVGNVSAAWVAVLCLGATSFATWYLMSLISQNVLGFNPLEAGLMFLPMTIVVMVMARVAGIACSRFGGGKVLGAGMIVVAAGVFWLSRIPADGTFLHDILGPSLVIGLGFGTSYVAVAVAATSGVPGPDAGLASALTNMGRQVGGSLGIALVSAVAASRADDLIGDRSPAQALNGGYTTALFVALAFSLVGAAISFAGLGPRPQRAGAEPAGEPGIP
jgi:hypothetical protein